MTLLVYKNLLIYFKKLIIVISRRNLLIFLISTSLIMAGCATQITKKITIKIDQNAVANAKYVEFIYVENNLQKINYLNKINADNGIPLPKLECKQTPWSGGFVDSRGAWIWKSSLLLNNYELAKHFFHDASIHKINRIYLQIHADIDQYEPLLKMAKNENIQIYALAGDPDYINKQQSVLALIDGVLRFNANHLVRFSGIQLDVEPYALPDYGNHEKEILSRYLDLVRAVKKHIAGRILFGFAVPFWFDQKSVSGVNLMASIIRESDFVAIMSYRTSNDQILLIANNALCYGEKFDKPVYLGIELTRIPDEVHFIFRSSALLPYIHNSNLTREPTDGLPYIKKTVILGSRISFYPNPKKAFSMTEQVVPYQSFSGWIFNGLDETWMYD